MVFTRDQVKMILQTVRYLELEGEKKQVEVTLFDYDKYHFNALNIFGLKHLLKINKTVFEFENPDILDSSTDLIKNIYEGGFKIWESTEDLLIYLINNDILKKNQKILDIGCGSGLLGIAALKKKASLVHFLDYNLEVLQWFTLPNILNNLCINLNSEKDLLDLVLHKSGFYPGDWEKVDTELNNQKYDIILSSETIYSKDNYTKLLNLIKNHLEPNGKAYIAAKVYYFGVGGGIFEFIEFVEKDGILNVDVVETIEDNVQRKILMLTFKDQSIVNK